MWPVYRWLVDHNLPITTHSGINIVADDRTDLARPRRWLPVLEAFPALRLILAHMGGGFGEEAIGIARKYPQVMLDTAIAVSQQANPSANWLDDAAAVEMIQTVRAERSNP